VADGVGALPGYITVGNMVSFVWLDKLDDGTRAFTEEKDSVFDGYTSGDPLLNRKTWS
jgi:hypothetical protein